MSRTLGLRVSSSVTGSKDEHSRTVVPSSRVKGRWRSGTASALHYLNMRCMSAEGPGFDPPSLQFVDIRSYSRFNCSSNERNTGF